MKRNPVIRELTLSDKIDNIYAISLVKYPAIEENFQYFKKILQFKDEDKWYYSLKPEYSNETLIIPTSHKLCASKALGDKMEYTTKEVKSWVRHVGKKDWGFTPDAASWFGNFPGDAINHQALDLPMYNCRHCMMKKTIFHNYISVNINFEMVDDKKKKIRGPVMVANKLILRPPDEVNDIDYGYVYYSNDTLEKFYDKYGKKANTTFLHEFDISKHLYLTKSWIDKSERNWKWMCEFYVLSDFIWEQVKNGNVQGFSVEIVSTIK